MKNISLKSNAFKRFEQVLLVICLCVLALRATYTETTITTITNPDAVLGNQAFSLIVSSVLIFAVILWFAVSLLQKQFIYRSTGIEIGLLLFLIAAIIATFVASNKRAAIIELTTIIAPVLMAILLVQILETPAKIKLVFIIIIALTITSGYQCTEQLLSSNEDMVKDYQQDPARHLEPLGIEPGSLNHFMYQHRLFSKDTRGFLTTSNSTGSFVILALFTAIALALEKFKNRRSNPSVVLITSIAVIPLIAACLVITFSKGAIAAALLAGVMLAVSLRFTDLISKYRKPLLVLTLLLLWVAVVLIVNYGITHDRLPGGNSMLVRWQYWTSAAKMYMLKPFTGIGPGNFASYYPAYKVPAALETVRDPHNFILSLLIQYGPLGLVGFALLIIVPIIRLCKNIPPRDTQPLTPTTKPPTTAALLSIIITMLILRPILIASSFGDRIDVMIYVFIVLYVVPVCVFTIAFWILNANQKRSQLPTQLPNTVILPLSIGLIAVLIHNLIDYALFEPAVLTTFFAVLAAIIAIHYTNTDRKTTVLNLNRKTKLAIISALAILSWFHISYSITPTIRSSVRVQLANRRIDLAKDLLTKAAHIDPLSPAAPHSCGVVLLQQFHQISPAQPVLLESAAKCFSDAIDRDHADYRNYEKLATTYRMLAEIPAQTEKQKWFQRSFDAYSLAVEHYPGSGLMRFRLARVALELKKNQIALGNYEMAVRIEDAYRDQFRIMYPDEDIFSRLGAEKYQIAKESIEKLK